MGRLSARSIWNGATSTWPKRALCAAALVGVVAVCFAVRHNTGPSAATAQAPADAPPGGIAAPAAPAAPPQPTDVVAIVNGQPFTRQDLLNEALYQHGRDVVEVLVNKLLITDYCAQNNIVITRQQVEEEIARTAGRFGVERDDWLAMLEKERNITPHQYAEDIVWPTVALRTIAAASIQPTEQEVQQAYETQFGPSVQCRLIALSDKATADKVYAQAIASPDEFGNLAKQYSVDVNSASAKGLIQPIRRHQGDPNLEQAAFALEKGQISAVIPVMNQFVILKCENIWPARNVPLDQPLDGPGYKGVSARKVLEDAIRDKKLRLASGQVFEQLKAQSKTEIVYLDPVRHAQDPTVAAFINGRPLTVEALAQECAARHGKAVLEAMIGRRLLEQAIEKSGEPVTQADIDAELARVALNMGKTKTPGGSDPDVEAWIKQVTEAGQVTAEQYIRDQIWPSVVLRKLVGNRVQVSDEDLKKGFEANYGTRVKCRAIVLNQMRRAQEVWQMARDNPTVENFGMLAEQYSIDSVSRTLRGEVPPIQQHGGRPALEKEAFTLQPGELSGIIQVGDNYVILLCEGRTEPRQIDFAEVRELIAADLAAKKLRVEMNREFDRLNDTANIDNFLTGTVKSPTLSKEAKAAAAAAQGQATPADFQSPLPPR